MMRILDALLHAHISWEVQKATVDNHGKAGSGSAINGSVVPASLQLNMGENPSQKTVGYATVGGK